MTPALTCPKCSGQMEEGFVLDRTLNTNLQEKWVEGPAARSVWTGMKLKGREQIPVTTSRCSECGYLESFALRT